MIYKRNPMLMTVMGMNPGPRRKRPVDDPIDHAIGQAWHRLMSGVQVSVLDIPKIFRDVKLEVAAGMPLEEAVMRVGQRFRVNRNGYRRNPSLAASLAGGMAGAFVTHAMSNPGPGRVDEHGARELQLYIDNDSRLYHQQFLPIVKNLMKRRAKGVYDREKAAKLFLYLVDEGARRYYKEFGSPGAKFNLATRWQVAKELRDSFEAEAGLGNYDRTTWGVSNNPRKKSSRHTIPQANPGASKSGRRKVTMTIEKFAQWVRGKKDPAMWKAFLAKFKGYEKWTHGARARKVTLEWQDVPGMTGLWITYDGGKQPESTYIMPKGSPRKGAWRHPWDTMPDIKHDPGAGVVLTKLRGKSKITDFYHR